MFLKTFITFFALQSLASIISIILRQYDFYTMSIVLILLPLAICSLSYPFYPVNIFSESFSAKIIFVNMTVIARKCSNACRRSNCQWITGVYT